MAGTPARIRPAAIALSPEELAQKSRNETNYVVRQLPVMTAIERCVCGCDYGGTSWTTRAEAGRMAAYLGLAPGRRLLDLGSGSGWPALYMARLSGCDTVLLDLPLPGLRIAIDRTIDERLTGACWATVADASHIPFADDTFDAISHSDVLCCLRNKRSVLAACRRVIRRRGTMVFSVISVPPNLSHRDYRRAVDIGPEFIETDVPYPVLLEQTGWHLCNRQDVTRDYEATCRRQLSADEDHMAPLQAAMGMDAVTARMADWRARLAAFEGGLIQRDIFVARPAWAP